MAARISVRVEPDHAIRAPEIYAEYAHILQGQHALVMEFLVHTAASEVEALADETVCREATTSTLAHHMRCRQRLRPAALGLRFAVAVLTGLMLVIMPASANDTTKRTSESGH